MFIGRRSGYGGLVMQPFSQSPETRRRPDPRRWAGSAEEEQPEQDDDSQRHAEKPQNECLTHHAFSYCPFSGNRAYGGATSQTLIGSG
jgi:hypothetical protein